MAVRAEEHGALLDRPIELQERIFERLFRTAEIAKMSRQQLYEYEESLKNYRDWRNVLDNAQYEGHVLGLEQGLKKGRAEGIEQGRSEGVNAEKRATAIRMLSLGMDDETISQISGLTAQEIKALRD